jgi:hypothetical protein
MTGLRGLTGFNPKEFVSNPVHPANPVILSKASSINLNSG